MEIWRNIDGFTDYQVSNKGNVKSIKFGKERILKPNNVKGYQQVQLYRDGEPKNMYIHQLVAQAFLPNPENLPEVNHIDENKTNNNVNNLEWCDREYNNNFGTHNQRSAKTRSKLLTGVYNTKKSKPVRCIETNIIYPSTAEVKRQLGFAQQNICDCCNGKRKSCGGYHWEWV